MKKMIRKLTLRKETVRELTAKALTQVIGGQETVTVVDYPQTGIRQCTSGRIVVLDSAANQGGH